MVISELPTGERTWLKLEREYCPPVFINLLKVTDITFASGVVNKKEVTYVSFNTGGSGEVTNFRLDEVKLTLLSNKDLFEGSAKYSTSGEHSPLVTQYQPPHIQGEME